jgi:hypothetical protein
MPRRTAVVSTASLNGPNPGCRLMTRAVTGMIAKTTASVRDPPMRSASQPPTGRASVASTTNAAPGPISVAVREGRVRFATSDGEVEAGPETLLALDGGVRHAVEALEDAVCVITIARGGRS